MSSWKLDVPNIDEIPERIFNLPNRLIVGAGPVNFSPRVIAAMTRNTTGSICNELFQMQDDIQRMLKYVFQTKNDFTMAHQVSGTGGIEVAITNLADPGEKVIVAVGGVWGERTAETAKVRNLDVIKIVSPPGEVFSFEELEREIVKHKPVMLIMTHGESSGGTNQSLDGLGKICHKYNCLLVVDAVVSLGGVPFFVDRWEIDCAIAAAQKAIGAPPGMAFLTFSPRAVQKAKSNKCPPPLYYDIMRSAETWRCYGDRTVKKYHYTYNSHMLCSVREALLQVCEEGLENAWERHRRNSERFCDELEKMGLQLYVRKEIRLWTVTCVVLPSDVKWHTLLEYLLEKHDVVVTPGIGPTYNKAIRIGIMGYNSRPEVVDYVLKVLKKGIEYCQSEEGQKASGKMPKDVM